MSAVIKQHKCKVCGEMYTKNKTTQQACKWECALKMVVDKNKKKQDEANKEWRKEKKVRKDKLKTLSDWTKDAQVMFNRFIRLRDENLPCISCGIKIAKWDAGHFKSIGGYPELRFMENNCHKQCAQCNSNKSGNIHEMRKGMIARIGIDAVVEIEGPHEAKHYRIPDVQEIREFYRLKVKEMVN